jgi:hypothetical protein
MLPLKIYLAGLFVLVAAIGLNLLAGLLGLATWYSFLTSASQQGLPSALNGLKIWDYLFLFLLYPGLLGLSAFLVFYLSSLIK